MWWTAITFAAVAAWFEWQYRHKSGRKAPDNDPAAVPSDDLIDKADAAPPLQNSDNTPAVVSEQLQ